MSLPPFISTMAPPPLTAPTIAGPSRSAAQFEIKQLDCCKVCLGGLGHRYSLEYTEDNLLACPRCGLVDEAATQARNAVSVSDTMGAQLDQHDYMRTFDRDWGEFETRMEKKFKVGLS
jgi:hypothetical protein